MKTEEKTLLIIIRHGESEGNVAGTKMAELEKSNHEFILTLLGHKQALAARNHVISKYGNPHKVFCSTFIRSLETAEYFSQVPIMDSRLDERWDGVLHGLSEKILKSDYPHEIALREKYGWYHHRACGGENGPDVEMKIRSFVSDIYTTHPQPARIVIAGHGNWMLIFERLIKNLSVPEINRMKKETEIANGCVSVYRIHSPFEIEPVVERVIPDKSVKSKREHFA